MPTYNGPSEWETIVRKALDEARAQGQQERQVHKVIRRREDGNSEVLDIVEMYQTGSGVVVVVR